MRKAMRLLWVRLAVLAMGLPLPGTTGWGTNFGGLSTVLWNPQAQSGSFAFRTNQFGFPISGTSNLVVVVEACTNLLNPAWSPLQTNTLNGSPLYFTDPPVDRLCQPLLSGDLAVKCRTGRSR
jgi:hypothetical protein